MGQRKNTREYIAASFLLRETGISLCQAARLVQDGAEALPPELSPQERWAALRSCLRRGLLLYQEEQSSTTFSNAAEHVLQLKQGQSPRTIQDFRQIMKRLMEKRPSLQSQMLNTFTTAQCSRLLEETLTSPVTQIKARACLSVLFREGVRQGWCRQNPIQTLPTPKVREKTITPLTPEEIQRMLRTAALPAHLPCLPPLLLMLYAGVRPQEITRLTYACIDLAGGEIIIPPSHSKTGGGRHITICPTLQRRLRALSVPSPSAPICPPNWVNRWKRLRLAAGFSHWQQDILRHTFASYFARAYRDLPTLQIYMGHRDVRLLLTRYVNLNGTSRPAAARFFGTGTGKAF